MSRGILLTCPRHEQMSRNIFLAIATETVFRGPYLWRGALAPPPSLPSPRRHLLYAQVCRERCAVTHAVTVVEPSERIHSSSTTHDKCSEERTVRTPCSLAAPPGISCIMFAPVASAQCPVLRAVLGARATIRAPRDLPT